MSNNIIGLIIILTNSDTCTWPIDIIILTDIANQMYVRNVGFYEYLLQKDGFKWPCMWSSLGGK